MPATSTIGILAATDLRAERIAQDLDLPDAHIIDGNNSRGRTFDIVIIEDGALPLSVDALRDLAMQMCGSTTGRIYRLTQISDFGSIAKQPDAAGE
ncbi:hypothetical protein [Mycolicibacterium sphagni]|uniref:hypothetical protein n=1 Tax=Mycolicibacterium sphagni TaxID=1786 RepID=UPI0021F3948D|nr:hypothetical protein [Mycolicibacterium sphagni]MCV7175110.1 hypothetical protein [Mycolicibacterium sphagni]